jgi:formate dehydrogenase subunit delta
MNTDLMIKMVNEISAFFAGEDDQAQAARDVQQHLMKFWEPRMRAQLLEYFEQRQGAGLSELSTQAVTLLAQESRPDKVSAPSATG